MSLRYRKWFDDAKERYDVAISAIPYGSETVASFDTEEEALEYAQHLITLPNDQILTIAKTVASDVGNGAILECVFIDKWIGSDIDDTWREVKFNLQSEVK